MDMHVTQWCDDPGSVHEIVQRFRQPTMQELWELGCHWVPAQFAANGTVIEVVTEFFLFGRIWHLVKVDIEGAEKPGYTLVRVS